MKINAKYGIVAALTMAAFVAPSVGAFTVTDKITNTNPATNEAVKTAKVTLKDGDTIVFPNIDSAKQIAFEGLTYKELLNSVSIKDKDTKEETTVASIASEYSGLLKSDGTALTWKDGTTEITSSNEDNVVALGAHTITITDGTNTATGTITIIKNINVTTSPIKVTGTDGKALTYTGSAVTPVFTVGGVKIDSSDIDGSIIYTDTTKNTQSTTAPINTGSYTAAFTVKAGTNFAFKNGNLTEYVTANFTVAPQVISADKVSLNITGNEKGYTGSEIELSSTELVVTALTKDTDYTVSYSNNTNIGTATVKITGKGNYTGTITKTFDIKAKKDLATADIATAVFYTGSPITPVKVGGYTNGYTISFANDVNHTDVGTAKFTFIGDGKNIVTTQDGIEGTLTINQLTINLSNVTTDDAKVFTNASKAKKYSLENNCVTVVLSSKAYGVTPTIKAIYANGNEVSTSLYSIDKFEPATKEGDPAEITLKGDAAAVAKGNIAATGQIIYKTVGASIADATVSGIAKAYTYNGKTKEPTPTVTLNGEKLVEGTDYVVSYKSNINVGTATVVITGAGDYSGSITKTFYIDPAKSSVKKVAVGAKKMTVTVKKGTKATGVQIGYRVKGTSKWSYTKTTSTSKTIKSLKKGKKYQVVVRSYTTNKSGKITNYSGWSATKTSAKIK